MIIIPGKNKNLARRYCANVLDYTILFILISLYIFATGEDNGTGTYHVRGLKAFAIPCLWFFYFPLAESIGGQTLGKKAFNLFVIDAKGESPTIVDAFFRRMLDFVELIFFGIPSLLSINHTKKNQRIGDRIAGTTVITTQAICRHFNTELELTKKEVVNNRFNCPTCNEVN